MDHKEAGRGPVHSEASESPIKLSGLRFYHIYETLVHVPSLLSVQIRRSDKCG